MAGLVGAGVFPVSSPHMLSLQPGDGQNGHNGLHLGQSLGQLGDGRDLGEARVLGEDRVLGEAQRLGEVGDLSGRGHMEGDNDVEEEETESKHWNREATEVLIEAWSAQQSEGHKNLTQSHWQAVVDSVNNRRGGGKPRKNIAQCKHRIDTLKKVYKKLKKARTRSTSGDGTVWPYYDLMEYALSIRNAYRAAEAEGELSNRPMGVIGGHEGGEVMRPQVQQGAMPAPVGVEDPYAAQRTIEMLRARKRVRLDGSEFGGPANDIAAALSHFAEVYKRMEHSKLDLMSRVEQNKTELMLKLEESRMKAQQDLEQFKIQSRIDLEVRREELHVKAQLEREKFEESKKLGKEQLEQRVALEKEQLEVRKLEIQLELEKLRMKREELDKSEFDKE